MQRLFATPDTTLERYISQHSSALMPRLWLRNIRISRRDLDAQLAELDAQREQTAAQLDALRQERYPADALSTGDPVLDADRVRQWTRQREEIARIHLNRSSELRRKRDLAAKQLDGIERREAIERTRPLSCFCLGFGGDGYFILLAGVPSWERWCLACDEGRAMDRAAYDARAAFFAQLGEQFGTETAPETDGRRELLTRAGIDPAAERLDLDELYVDDGKRDAFDAALALLDRLETQHAGRWLEWGEVEGQPGVKTTITMYPPVEKPWLYLYGESGCGKSTLSRAMLARWVLAERSGYIVNLSQWLAQLRASFEKRDDATHTSAILAPLRTRRLLVLDDFGAEPPTAYTRSTLYEILNCRYERRLPTIISSNLGPIEAVDRLGGDAVSSERLVSRIAELAELRELAGLNFRNRQPILAGLAL